MQDIVCLNKTDTGITTLTLNRTQRHNALDADLVSGLLNNLNDIQDDEDTRVLVLAAAGTSFCSGADLKQVQKTDDTDDLFARQLQSLLKQLYSLPKATIARVNGLAYGGGVGLIACCDFAIAVEHAHMSFTELHLGLIPAVIAPYISTATGARRAKQLFLSGKRITASQALHLGLFTQVVPETELDHAVQTQAEALLKAGPCATAACKRLMAQLAMHDALQGIDTADEFTKIKKSAEAQEGISAFFEKRKPKWQL